jgi:hypothetical protein
MIGKVRRVADENDRAGVSSAPQGLDRLYGRVACSENDDAIGHVGCR